MSAYSSRSPPFFQSPRATASVKGKHWDRASALSRSFEEATRILTYPYLHVDNHDLAILGWTLDYGSTTLFLDESIPVEHQIEGRHNIHKGITYHSVFSYLDCHHKYFCSATILHRIFANICNLRGINTRQVDFSIRAHTFAPRNAIPSVVHVAVRRVQKRGGSYLSIWPIWIRADVLPPDDPTAIQLAASTNSNSSYKRPLLH